MGTPGRAGPSPGRETGWVLERQPRDPVRTARGETGGRRGPPGAQAGGRGARAATTGKRGRVARWALSAELEGTRRLRQVAL